MAGQMIAAPHSAYDAIRRDAQERIESENFDPTQHRDRVVELIRDAVADYSRTAQSGHHPDLADTDDMIDRLTASFVDWGPLTGLLSQPDVEEIFIEGSSVRYITSGGHLHGLAEPVTAEEMLHIVERLLGDTSRHLDAQQPLVQARVLNQTARLTAAIPPVSETLSATLRRSVMRRHTLADMVAREALDRSCADMLWAIMQTRNAVLVSGQPGSGKTSLLAAMLDAIPSTRCVRVVEENRELTVPLAHGSYYEARPPSLDGNGAISLRDLVKFVLAMRPDVIVVGEVRGPESFELTRAVNAGVGFACTVHANTGTEALRSLVNTAIMAESNINEAFVRRQFAACLDFVVHLDMEHDGPQAMRRGVLEVAEVTEVNGDFKVTPILTRGSLAQPLAWTGELPAQTERIDRVLPDGMSVRSMLEQGVRA